MSLFETMGTRELISRLHSLFEHEPRQELTVSVPFDRGQLVASVKKGDNHSVSANMRAAFTTSYGLIKGKIHSDVPSRIAFSSSTLIPFLTFQIGCTTDDASPLTLKTHAESRFLGATIIGSQRVAQKAGPAVSAKSLELAHTLTLLHEKTRFSCQLKHLPKRYSVEFVKTFANPSRISIFAIYNRPLRSLQDIGCVAVLADKNSTISLLTSWESRSIEFMADSMFRRRFKVGFTVGASEIGQRNRGFGKLAVLAKIDDQSHLKCVLDTDRSLGMEFYVGNGNNMAFRFFGNLKMGLKNTFGGTVKFDLPGV
jgi:hypothetical protein